ncbi:molybdopterin converting factor subunit 1 [Pseudoxanthomonas dokdonensis]|uniref:Molybdopterin synthase sulfur carrier subunit n=1 Tax=Pseudoxanthomonas dokdonensis TaxID=344882 RepID=A0A0R0CT93_9GAMM|nr:molybdopterin converting factor subunit 1 [Pseudoxanthomonas dokdonensis]KRG68088.1 molybdopterin biosynthesis protein D chain [Pseudoxanthomonas dokdonensis]
MIEVKVRYFASLRDAAGTEQETVQTDAGDLAGLYRQLQSRHGFSWPQAHLRVAVADDFAHWDDPLREGSEVAFIPPVSGG